MPEKEHWWSKRRIYYWGPWIGTPVLFEQSRDPQWLLHSKKRFFFLVMVYDKVSDGDKHSYETLVLEDLVFMLPVTLKLKLNNFSWIPCNSH